MIPPILRSLRQLLHLASDSYGEPWTPEMVALFEDARFRADVDLEDLAPSALGVWIDLVEFVESEQLLDGVSQTSDQLLRHLVRYNNRVSQILCAVPSRIDDLGTSAALELHFPDEGPASGYA